MYILLYEICFLVIFISFIVMSRFCIANKSSHMYSINYLKKCMSYNLEVYKLNINRNYYFGKDLWKEISTKEMKYACSFFRKMGLCRYDNMYFYHRLYSSKRIVYNKISTNGKFPSITYFRLVPKNKNNYQNVITHTYYVQDYLYSYQHPINCFDRKYLIIRGFYSGHGSEIHVITSYFSLALSTKRIAIFDPNHISPIAKGDYCKKYKNWLCFLEQLTNCSLSYIEYLNANKYISISQNDKCLYIGNTQKYRYVIPKKIIQLLQNTSITKNKMLHYWRIQAATYIFRLNEKTNAVINNIIKKSLGNRLDNGCFNIWVRHGDKYKEMMLLSPKDYIYSYNIFRKLVGYDIPLYLSTDDFKVLDYYLNNTTLTTFYIKFLRTNDNLRENMKKGDRMTLYFIADIKAALYCNAFSGTRKSNVIRLIDELRSTVGLSANSFYFENGVINISNNFYEYDEFW